MPRSGLSRLLSVALLLTAGFFEPAWELGHGVLHLEAAHDARHSGDPASLSILAADDELGHEHPVFQSPAKPGADLVFAIIALPAQTPELPTATLTVPRAAFLAAPARASPVFGYTAQPRAPPLA